MPVDPQIQALLDKGTGVPATHTLPVDAARRQYEARIAVMAPPAEVAKVASAASTGRAGRCSCASTRRTASGRSRCMVFFHGSGFVLCSLDTHDGMCRNLCGRRRLRRRLGRLSAGAGAQIPAGPTIAWRRRAGPRRTRRSSAPIRRASWWPATAPAATWPRSPRCACATRAARRCRPVAALSGDRLSHARHALLRRERRGLRADARHDGVVLGRTI